MSSAAALDFSGMKLAQSENNEEMHALYPYAEKNLITLSKDDRSEKTQNCYQVRKLAINPKEKTRRRSPSELVGRKVALPTRPVDVENGKFPFCLVWVPLPIVAWLVPFVGHVGICREDGVILDFAGNINIDNLAFGSTAKFVRLSRELCCFPNPQYGHTCKNADMHPVAGMAYSWDDAVTRSVQVYGRKSYNFFTCNCHSFVANCMNRMAYGGSSNWNLVDVLLLVLLKGEFVNLCGFLKSYVPFVTIMAFGLHMAGMAFFYFWVGFSTLLLGWFTYGTYAFRGYIDC